MKRFFAALMALLMLIPALALGEATHVTLHFNADAKQVNAWLQENGIADARVAKIINLIADLRVNLYSQTDGEAVTLSLGDETFATLWTRPQEDGSTLLLADAVPSQALVIPAREASLFEQILSKTDGLSLLTMLVEMGEEGKAWKDALPVRVDHGLFSGDAFSGGNEQYTYEISGNDMAILALQLTDKLDALQPVDPDDAPDYQALKTELQKAILQDAREGRQRWIAREVRRDGTTIGISVTVFENGEQVMTLSVGLENPDAPRIVAGAGIAGSVFFVDAVLSAENADPDAAALKCSADIWLDPYHDGFPGAKAVPANRLGHLESVIRVTAKESSFVIGGEATLTRDGFSALREEWEIGAETATGMLSARDALFIGDNAQPAFEVLLDSEPTDAYPTAEWPEGEPIPVDFESEAFIGWAAEAAMGIGTRLVFLVPADVLMMFLQ